ncbi:protein-tyrosine-phosphatase [Prevotella dentalis DSM 3688]|uniref:protein-tyrosine-phosphatase n=1 Tax=Prevotella dentalis (strain ATCC 49559 / DSM 3688 / JCM 13448 / NCTC 12043 / ES 2772) TaxID=908937 RepID=F9D5M6_PREDD|nr:low molecular weight protein-tyrosine-phosphatase [Prevotella dentalis]AGB29256.1 protein-tyrosine-phosphatase [Prevotella dentalis DSM 3688]EGQ13178.1 protein tyrosine phosphatase [Prevotella dentalis DSM 3688]
MTKKGNFSVLFICLGNICRSPAAQGILEKMVRQRGLDHLVHIDSAGIGGWHVGQLPDERMRSHGRAHGYEFDHRARQFDARTDLDRFDLIVTMDDDNYEAVMSRTRTPEQRARVTPMSTLFNAYAGHASVPDPYYGGAAGFELAISLIEDACQTLIDKYLAKR